MQKNNDLYSEIVSKIFIQTILFLTQQVLNLSSTFIDIEFQKNHSISHLQIYKNVNGRQPMLNTQNEFESFHHQLQSLNQKSLLL